MTQAWREPNEEELLAAAKWFTWETGIPVVGVPLEHGEEIVRPKWIFPLYDPYEDFVDLDEEGAGRDRLIPQTLGDDMTAGAVVELAA